MGSWLGEAGARPVRPLLLAVFAVVGLFISGCSGGQSATYAYSAAMYTSTFGVSQELEVFPFVGKAFRIPLPFPLGVLECSPDGRAMYASAFNPLNRPGSLGLYKIEFSPFRVAPVAGSNVLGYDSFAFTADQDKIVVAGGGLATPCGIFELDLRDGRVKTIVFGSPCDPLNSLAHWGDLSLSTDGRRATAFRYHHLELIDLVTAKVTVLEGLEFAAWSPDGKWLAVMKEGSDDTILLDARTLTRRRNIGATSLKWSPDSRYLLNEKFPLLCGLGEIGTLETVDVNTGVRREITSSRCKINMATLGWVNIRAKPR